MAERGKTDHYLSLFVFYATLQSSELLRMGTCATHHAIEGL